MNFSDVIHLKADRLVYLDDAFVDGSIATLEKLQDYLALG